MGEDNEVRSGFVEFYRDADGDWRWRAKAANGEVVADSAEGYRNRADAENGLRATSQAILGASIESA